MLNYGATNSLSITDIMGKEKASSAGNRSEELLSKTRAWLTAENYTLDPKTRAGYYWVIIAHHETKPGVGIFQMINNPDRITIQGWVAFTKQEQDQFDLLPADERDRLKTDIGLRLLHVGVEFDRFQEPLAINIMNHIYMDGFTRDTFMRRLGEVHRAMLMAGWTVRQKISQIAPDQGPVIDPKDIH